jgi:hypothetical protein
MHCHPLFVSVVVILTIIFAIGLAETDPTDWTHGERFDLLCSISLGRMHNYCLLFLMWLPFITSDPLPVTYVYILLRQECCH